MPCAVAARGIRQAAPHTSPLAFLDAIQDNPCGEKAMTGVTGQTGVAAENLCQWHWILKHGTLDFVLPVTTEP
jgi:hypothetical protein